ncbi:MAG: acetate--CoA ligase [Myxococcota bacterium]|nr:acetate--CoA ligase [Myxococcota bacterium]
MENPDPQKSVYETMITPAPGQALQNLEALEEARRAAATDPDQFWLREARALQWAQAPTVGLEGDFNSVREAPLRWFSAGHLTVTVSCVDRHAEATPEETALIWEGDEPDEVERWSWRQLHEELCRAANALSGLGIKQGDRVIIYMGMVPQAAVAMLACARIGAVHSVVFGGFSAEALRDRVIDCGACAVITQDEGRRGGRPIPLKAICDEALEAAPVEHVIVYQRSEEAIELRAGRDHWWHTLVERASPIHEAEAFPAEHPLFILYTSGSTGKPKGVVHSCGGYLCYASYTHRTVFGLQPGDVYGCVADVGWITGHSYIVYGPLANGATTLLFESTPLYPDPSRYWSLVERHKVNIFYTAPTAIRALAAQGDHFVTRHDLSSLRVLGTVGEPINPEAWRWYYEIVGGERCALVDTWWQTETGGICIAPVATLTPCKPGSATRPLPGILPRLVDDAGCEIEGEGEGRLCLMQPWPGQARTVYGDHPRFVQTYFSDFPGMYFTGDGCRRDADGDYWITGRVDDVLNVSGHRMGTAEFEAALILDEGVAEAAVVGYPHSIKGQGVCAWLVLRAAESSEALNARLQGLVRQQIGAHAKLDRVIPIPGLPKTRSGKVMRRILRKVAEGAPEALGDISTLADPAVVPAIISAAAETP